MSIKIEVKDYCQDCPDFDPRVKKHDFGSTLGMLTEVHCTHNRRCEEIYKTIKDELRKEIENGKC